MCQDINFEDPFHVDRMSLGAPSDPTILQAQEHDGPLPRIQNVGTAAQTVHGFYKQGEKKMMQLQDAINHLTSFNCAYCWLSREPTSVHEHSDGISYRVLKKALEGATFSDSDRTYSPICYRCWIPFHHPFHHSAIAKQHDIIEEHCPYNSIIPRIIPEAIARAYTYEKQHIRLYRDAIAKVLGVELWQDIPHFVKWLTEPVKGVSQLRNSHKFIVELHKLLRKEQFTT